MKIPLSLRGAIVGYGNVAASGHMPFWEVQSCAEIVAAVDEAASRRDLFEISYPGCRAYSTTEALLSAEALDFVDVCTPPNSHLTCIDQALDGGLHVLCEKPLAIAAQDALHIARKAKAAGLVIHVVHNWLEAPACRKVSQLLADGAIGQVRTISWSTTRTGLAVTVGESADGNWRMDPQRAGGGILFDHGWHALYCVSRWAAAAPRRVSAALENLRFSDWRVEDTAAVDIDFGKISAHVALTWAAEERCNTIDVVGERGRLRVSGGEVILDSSGASQVWQCPPSLAEGSHHPEWFAAVASDFIAAIGGSSGSNIDEAVNCSFIIDAAQESSAQGSDWVKLNDNLLPV